MDGEYALSSTKSTTPTQLPPLHQEVIGGSCSSKLLFFVPPKLYSHETKKKISKVLPLNFHSLILINPYQMIN